MSAVARAARAKRKPMDISEASRQLRRSTLGCRKAQLDAVVGQRFDQWVDAQLALPVTAGQMYTAMDTRRLPGFPTAPVLDQGWYACPEQFMNWKLYQPEVLRTRLVYAFLEFFSVGGLRGIFEGRYPHAVLWDHIESEVTQGTFRSLIEKITRSQPMGRWLTYFRNAKTDGVRQPDENYGREIMQLYTIGLWELNLDGSRRKAGELNSGDPRYVAGSQAEVPTYNQMDVANMARVFTGLTARGSWDDGVHVESANTSWDIGLGGDHSGAFDSAGRQGWAAVMEFASDYHESTLSKVALQGRVNIPAGTNGDTSLAMALNALVAHPSAAPYLATRFIQLLTTSNPSPDYIARVASVFRDDGAGQTGNLRAFFRAILLDQEVLAPVAKGLTCRVPSFEEQRLALVLSHPPKLTVEGAPLAVGENLDYPGSPNEGDYYPGKQTVQSLLIGMSFSGPHQLFCNPSVFGRWPSAYRAAGNVFAAGLFSPELASLTEGNVTDLIDGAGELFQRIGNVADPADLADVMPNGNRSELIDRLSFLLTGVSIPSTFKTQLLNYLASKDARLNAGTNNMTRRAEAYRDVAAALWLSPWSISRR